MSWSYAPSARPVSAVFRWHPNNVFIAAANCVSTDRDACFLGCSLIAGTDGWPIGHVAPR
ncbi:MULTISPECIES: hypothetical protein [unclassified Nonomuraea]|uniref:hypothetical protein n=1 Tax=unclassified Nonomuraea TaxID=2593643 RepID=UPI0033DAA443